MFFAVVAPGVRVARPGRHRVLRGDHQAVAPVGGELASSRSEVPGWFVVRGVDEVAAPVDVGVEASDGPRRARRPSPSRCRTSSCPTRSARPAGPSAQQPIGVRESLPATTASRDRARCPGRKPIGPTTTTTCGSRGAYPVCGNARKSAPRRLLSLSPALVCMAGASAACRCDVASSRCPGSRVAAADSNCTR